MALRNIKLGEVVLKLGKPQEVVVSNNIFHTFHIIKLQHLN
jgi:hypothetical protein